VPARIESRDESQATAPPANISPELQETFDRVRRGRQHNGTPVIDLDDYLEYFNVTADRKGDSYGVSVQEKFRVHDVNNDGLLTLQEVHLVCDRHGTCTSPDSQL
jgi:Ca2+-binding EF-hand superfamily protein